MTRFYNPYQFIPLNNPGEDRLRDYEKIAAGQDDFIRHDRWNENALSGRIVCRLETISPLVIGARQTKGDKKANTPGGVEPYRDGQRLPANSLRGMIASVAESISNSAMRVLSEKDMHEYSVRKNMRDSLKAIGLLRKDENGWFVTPLALSALFVQNRTLPDKWKAVFQGLKLNLKLKECLAHYVGNYASPHVSSSREVEA
ncbi:hypothetical protein [Thiolapillus sp.]